MDNFRALPKLNEKLQELADRSEARLATVVQSYGREVDVMLTGGAVARYASTVSGLRPGDTGAVIRGLGGKGLFVAMGVTYPITDRVGGSMSVTATSSGYHWNTSATATIENLNPNRQYTVEGHPSIRTTGTSSRRFVPMFEAIGATTVSGGILTDMASRDQEVTKGMGVIRLYPNANGVITLKPGFQWVSGTVSCNYAELVYTIS